MQNNFCPNHKGCQVINIEGFVKDINLKEKYINILCESSDEKWKTCKRYQTKKALNLCPDFVMPDSSYTIDEILDKIEK